MWQRVLRIFGRGHKADRYYYELVDNILGIRPNNIELYKLALIHRSASYNLEDGTPINNERLEYLGDAVLEAIVSDYLFIEFQKEDEGFLTQMRSKIVSGQTLNDLAVKMGMSEHIISQAGVGVVQKHLFGDALEAMIGAIYLDKGFEFTNRFVINNIIKEYIDIEDLLFTETDYKSRLIEWCQKSKHTISFETEFNEESTMQNPSFRSSAVIDEMEVGVGVGGSKKEAEQMASYAVSKVILTDNGDNLLHWIDEQMEEAGERSKQKNGGSVI